MKEKFHNVRIEFETMMTDAEYQQFLKHFCIRAQMPYELGGESEKSLSVFGVVSRIVNTVEEEV